jgi:hypothetical protein
MRYGGACRLTKYNPAYGTIVLQQGENYKLEIALSKLFGVAIEDILVLVPLEETGERSRALLKPNGVKFLSPRFF